MTGQNLIREQKRAWREQIAALILQRTPEARRRESADLCTTLSRLPDWQRAKGILLFAPMSTEPDVWPLVSQGLAEGKLVALPRFVRDNGRYEVAAVTEVDSEVTVGSFGIREPNRSCASLDLNQLDLALVPGLGFSLTGCRLGRGKGYYDLLLAGFGGVRGGIGWDEQLVPTLPSEPHDVHLDWILTPVRHWVIGSRTVKE